MTSRPPATGPIAAASPAIAAQIRTAPALLALSLGEQVYDPTLDRLRASIRNGEPRSGWHVAEGGIERKYEPVHLVGFAQHEPHTVVRVQLFGWNVWRVHFPRIASKAEPVGLRFDLRTNTLSIARPRLAAPVVVPQ